MIEKILDCVYLQVVEVAEKALSHSLDRTYRLPEGCPVLLQLLNAAILRSRHDHSPVGITVYSTPKIY
jgi:hypothetical protein